MSAKLSRETIANLGKVIDGHFVSATYPVAPEKPTVPSMVTLATQASQMGVTAAFVGPHGIGKTSVMKSVAETMGVDLVIVRASTITVDELLANAPIRGAEGQYVLKELINASLSQVSEDRKWILLIDDSLQASGQGLQNALMQVTCNWALGSYDLRERGCVGVFLTDNESLAETSAKRTDIAALDRMVTVEVSAEDTGWQQALARQFYESDLTEVFQQWSALPRAIRDVLSPRRMEHLITVLQAGFPGIIALPQLVGQRMRLVVTDKDGKVDDRTVEIIDGFAKALGAPNPGVDKVDDLVGKVMAKAVTDGWRVLVEGAPGCGKTEKAKAVVTEHLGPDGMVYVPLSITDMDMLFVPVPDGDRLQTMLLDRFSRKGDKVLVIDEFSRPKSKEVFAKLMEPLDSGRIAGEDIEGLRGIIALQNPKYVMGRKLNVISYNIAQADRFTVALEIGPDSTGANEWLLSTFPAKWAREVAETKARSGELEEDAVAEFVAAETDRAATVIEAIIEWHKNDIDDAAREWFSARGRERLARAYLSGMDIEFAAIYLGDGERAPVSLATLQRRLDDCKVTGIRDIFDNLEHWLDQLEKARTTDALGGEASQTVYLALKQAEMSQLAGHEDDIARLLPLLPASNRTPFLQEGHQERRQLFIKVLASLNK